MTDLLVSGLDYLDQDPWRLAFAKPLPGDEPIGDSLEDLFEFDAVQTELDKRGGLHQGSIDWDLVTKQSQEYLTNKTKDLVLIEALWDASRAKLGEAAPIASLLLSLSDCLRLYSGDYHPQRKPLRKAMWSRIASSLKSYDERLTSLEAKEILSEAVEDILTHLETLGIDTAVWSSVSRSLKQAPAQRLEVPDETKTAQQTGQSAPTQSAAGTQSANLGAEAASAKPAVATDGLDNLDLRPENERNFKKSLNAVADVLLQLQPQLPLDYELRRFATYYGIDGLPPLNKAGRLDILPPNSTARDTYEAGLSGQAIDPDIQLKLERATASAPFWFEGQNMAYRYAQKRGSETAARAIIKSTRAFYKSWPTLDELEFADGTKVISVAMADWLSQELEPETSGQSSDESQTAAEQMLEDPALESFVLDASAEDAADQRQALQASMTASLGQRAKIMGEIAVLEALQAQGLNAMVDRAAGRIKQDLTGLSVHDYEPIIMHRLSRLQLDT